MNKRCIFCNAPILSDYATKVYFAVKRLTKLPQLGEPTAKGIMEHLRGLGVRMSIQQIDNYLALLCQLDLVWRHREGRVFIYQKGGYDGKSKVCSK